MELNEACKSCAWHDDTAPRWAQCIPCRDTGVDISRDPVCRLYARKGEEGDRNQYGLEPCACGCRDVRVRAHWKGVGMGESCDCYIACPECGRTMHADDFGIRWNATMIKERQTGARDLKELWEDLRDDVDAEVLYAEKHAPHSDALGTVLAIRSSVERFGLEAGFIKKEEEE